MAVLLIAGLETYLSFFIRDYYILRLKENLLTQAVLLKDLVPSNKSLEDFCRMYKEKTGAGITVIDYSGQVLGNSDESLLETEGHLNRPEIKEATLLGSGSFKGFSSISKKEFFYVAIMIDMPEGKGFLRLSMPLDGLKSELGRIMVPIILSTFFILVIISGIGLYQSRRLRKDIRDIIEFSDGVASGNLEQRLFIDEKSELSRLAGHIIYMAEELKNKLIETKREKEILELVLKNMEEGLLIIGERGEVLLVNNALLRIFGIDYSGSDMTATEIVRDAELLSLIEDSKKIKETVSREISLRNDMFLSVIASPLKFSDRGEGIVVTFHDITKLKKLEQIRRDFVANVAHEIRTPITAIKGFAETLIDGAIEDRENAYRFLEIIKRHSERLNSLVNDLLTLSAIEQKEIRMEITDVNPSEIIDSLFTLVGEKAGSKGLYLKKALPDDIPLIKADRDRLFQILLNLIDNGIKFTDHGGVTVGIERMDERIILFVEDTGCGIEKKHISRLGERFYRVDRARSRELGGTGLGLAIVKHLVKAHGWAMEIESTPGRGTKVKIFIS